MDELRPGAGADTTFSLAVTVLRARIMGSGQGYANNVDDLDAMLAAPGTLGPAIAQSIHDMIRNATVAGMDEESRTASFFGHLASNLDWFAFVASLSPRDGESSNGATTPVPCGLYWAPQSKRAECENGGDFGVAVRSGDDAVRIKLYQAKRANGSGIASLYRKTLDKSLADIQLTGSKFPRLESRGVRRNINNNEYANLHQVQKLELWRKHGLRVIADSRRGQDSQVGVDIATEWCDYVFWFDGKGPESVIPAPVARSGFKLFHKVQAALREALSTSGKRRKAFDVQASGADFGHSLLFGDVHALVVSIDEAAVLIGQLHALGLTEFFAIDESGDQSRTPGWMRMFPPGDWKFLHLGGAGREGGEPTPSVVDAAAKGDHGNKG